MHDSHSLASRLDSTNSWAQDNILASCTLVKCNGFMQKTQHLLPMRDHLFGACCILTTGPALEATLKQLRGELQRIKEDRCAVTTRLGMFMALAAVLGLHGQRVDCIFKLQTAYAWLAWLLAISGCNIAS